MLECLMEADECKWCRGRKRGKCYVAGNARRCVQFDEDDKAQIIMRQKKGWYPRARSRIRMSRRSGRRHDVESNNDQDNNNNNVHNSNINHHDTNSDQDDDIEAPMKSILEKLISTGRFHEPTITSSRQHGIMLRALHAFVRYAIFRDTRPSVARHAGILIALYKQKNTGLRGKPQSYVEAAIVRDITRGLVDTLGNTSAAEAS
jgi:hypothetical protein